MESSTSSARLSEQRLALGVMFALVLGAIGWFGMSTTKAFNDRDVANLNVVLPMVRAGIRAYRRRQPLCPAILQAAFGGLMIRKAFYMAEGAEEKSAWQAWQAKLIMNVGASLAESAGGTQRFRMDLGPVWLVSDGGRIDWRLGLHGLVAPILNFSDGARVSWAHTIKYGTLAFTRDRNLDGTIGTRGALAYSNANNFITNKTGRHSGHELIHTFQYRRDTFLSPRLTRLIPALGDRLGERWVDDTGWVVSWGSQCLWAALSGKDRDFDIPMEKEAYFLADNVEF